MEVFAFQPDLRTGRLGEAFVVLKWGLGDDPGEAAARGVDVGSGDGQRLAAATDLEGGSPGHCAAPTFGLAFGVADEIQERGLAPVEVGGLGESVIGVPGLRGGAPAEGLGFGAGGLPG